MINIFVIAVVLGLGYLGVVRGFFSSLLHLVCVVIAGALAFAFWEPVAYAILTRAPQRGFLEFIEYSAWAIALIVPFAAALAVLRVASDKIVPANAQAVPLADHIGAAVCGGVGGIIVAGIVVIAIGTMRFPPDQFGYQPVRYQGASLQRTSQMLLPVDRIVGKLYAHTSEAAFETGQPLAKWRPEPWHAAEVMRINDRGKARNTARPKDFSLKARYRVEAAAGEDLLQDKWAVRPHEARMLSGDPYPKDARIEGIVLEIGNSLREPGASFVAITEGQVWMVAENTSAGERLTLHPVAVVANPKGAETSLARFQFDSNITVASAGATVRPMAFEFIVPNGYEPIAIYLKNIRKVLPPGGATEYDSVAARDMAIQDGSLIEGAEPIPVDFGEEPEEGPTGSRGTESQELGISVSNTLGRRLTIQRGTHKSLKVGEGNRIEEGEEKWSPTEVSSRVIARELLIDRFAVDQGVVMVQVDVSLNKPASLLGQAAAAAQRVVPPVLEDTNGLTYQCVGWIYKDRDMVYLRYTPGQTVRGLSELQDKRVTLSGSRDDQELILLFLCSQGAELTSFKIGTQEIIRLEEPLKLDKPQK